MAPDIISLSRPQFIEATKNAYSDDLTDEQVKKYFSLLEEYVTEHNDVYTDTDRPVSERQWVCAKRAVQLIMRGSMLDALHAMYEMLDDLGNKGNIAYHEYKLFNIVFEVYNNKC